MKVVLTNPPRSLYDRDGIAPPLGLLKLSSVARKAGAEVRLVDFNLLCQTNPELQGERFYENAVERLLAEGGDLYGFTSMGVDSHVALHLARLLKRWKPSVTTVVGGPHFSSVANDILKNYPWIDFVVKGEGEAAFEKLVRDLHGSRYEKPRAVLTEQSTQPWSANPAYDLVDLDSYFAVNPRRCINFEGGRGCRFKCSFCYSPSHYVGARNFSIDSKIEELSSLAARGASHAFFVEDNFLNDTAHAMAFCRELENLRLSLTWDCYATLPQLSTKLISAMANAGCSAIFTGVDAVGEVTQRAYRKGFFHGETVLAEKLHQCLESGITPTCAFLLSPPSHPCSQDSEQTLRAALTARNCGAQVRLNTLTLFNETKVETDHNFSIEADGSKASLMLDVPVIVERNEYAKTNPRLFPFHSRYVSSHEWSLFVSQVHCLFTLFLCYPQTLDSVWIERDISPRVVANTILSRVGDLFKIEKASRRDAELLAATHVLEELTISSKKSQDSLEAESDKVINW
jgi:radical SAM superfamily enzyme YgiQ (UPF0313 family)